VKDGKSIVLIYASPLAGLSLLSRYSIVCYSLLLSLLFMRLF